MLFMRLLMMSVLSLLVFFFQAEDGIRDFHVTSSDVCSSDLAGFHSGRGRMTRTDNVWIVDDDRSIRWVLEKALQQDRSEERRVGKECRPRRWQNQWTEKEMLGGEGR